MSAFSRRISVSHVIPPQRVSFQMQLSAKCRWDPGRSVERGYDPIIAPVAQILLSSCCGARSVAITSVEAASRDSGRV